MSDEDLFDNTGESCGNVELKYDSASNVVQETPNNDIKKRHKRITKHTKKSKRFDSHVKWKDENFTEGLLPLSGTEQLHTEDKKLSKSKCPYIFYEINEIITFHRTSWFVNKNVMTVGFYRKGNIHYDILTKTKQNNQCSILLDFKLTAHSPVSDTYLQVFGQPIIDENAKSLVFLVTIWNYFQMDRNVNQLIDCFHYQRQYVFPFGNRDLIV